MKRGAPTFERHWVFASLVALAGCRAVLGIDSLETIDGGSDAATDSGAPNKDASPPLDAPPPPGVDASACATNPQCPPCCRGAASQGFVDLESLAVSTRCICANMTGDCTTECGAAFCANTTSPPVSGCAMCLDRQLKDPLCQAARDQCTSSQCKTAINCLASCGPH